MNKIKVKIIYLIFSIFLFSFNFSNAEENVSLKDINSQKTISELKNNLKELEADKKYINFVFHNFLKNNGEIKKFLKPNLSKNDINFIVSKIKGYKIKKKEINKDYGKEIIKLRRELYEKIRPFILETKMELFNNFVKKDILRIEKTYKISSNIKETSKILNKKVRIIKGKILENQIKLNQKISEILEKKIRLKILIFKNSKKFKNLSDARKKNIFKLVINKIDKKILEMDKIKDKKKILTYKIMKKILLEE